MEALRLARQALLRGRRSGNELQLRQCHHFSGIENHRQELFDNWELARKQQPLRAIEPLE